MRIGLLSQWFDPEPGPAAIPAVFGREFIEQGHEVVALTGYPNYPTGAVYPGYSNRTVAHESVHGIDVTRVPLYPSHDASAIGRMLNYGSFALSASILGGRGLRGIDALWVYNSPVTVTLPMITHARRSVPTFLHVQDLWPDSLVNSGMLDNRLAARSLVALSSRVARLAESRATVIGVSSPGMKQILLERNPTLNSDHIVYVPNPASESLFRMSLAERTFDGNRPETDNFEVMYAGAVGPAQGLDALVDAAHLLRGEERIRISIVGDGISREQLARRARTEGLRNIRFYGRMPEEEIPRLLERAQVQLVSLEKSSFLEFTTPSKISNLLCFGTPIIGALNGDGARLIEDANAGLVVPPGEPDQLAAAILNMYEAGPAARAAFAANGRAHYAQHLSVARSSRTILDSLTN